MGENSETLWQELSALADSYADIGRGLLSAARKLHMPGVLPSDALIDELVRLRDVHRQLVDRCLAHAADLCVDVSGIADSESLKDLARLLEVLAAVEEHRNASRALVGSAVALLDRVIRLRHVHDESFAPLADCREQAGRLRESILGGTVDSTGDLVRSLAENDHPFAYLLMLVDGAEVVSDDLWESLFASVGHAFGRPLAAAVARAKITGADAYPVAVPLAHDEPVAAPVEAVYVPEPEPEQETELEPEPEPEAAPAEDEVAFAPVGATPSVPQGGPVWGVDQAMATLDADDLIDSVVEETMPFLHRSLSGSLVARRATRPANRKSAPRVERLETVRLLSCNVISGYVFLDANDDGLYQPATETPIAGNTLELRNAAGVVVGNAQTDAQGYYSFSTDSTISTAPKTVEQSVTIPAQLTNFSNPYTLTKFDPSLGELTGVDIIVTGSLTSDIKAENLSKSSPTLITATVSGTISLTGPGVNVSGAISSPAGTFNASVFDGTIDHAGTSGVDFGAQTAPISQSVSLVKGIDDLSSFIGPGTLSGTFAAQANSGANGGGNLDVEAVSNATATVRVVYHYTPSNCLTPGNYTIVQTQEPPGTLNGKDSSGGTVLPPTTSGPDTIPVTLGNTDSTNNDFGELQPSSLAGYVYYDQNDNGVKDTGEPGIPGTTITLQGTDDNGAAVNLSTQTDATGAYGFGSLRPGTYSILETQPAGYLDGKDTIGSQGGSTANDRFYGIGIGQNVQGVNNDFGELKVAGLSGYVYYDQNDNGVKDAGEPGIPGTTITLKGTDASGAAVNLSTQTDASGAYSFLNLLPGTYAITETQPAGYLDGKDTIGSQGGSTANDRFYGINLAADVAGVNNNFGELKPSSLAGYVYYDRNDNGVKDASDPAIPGTTVTLQGTDDNGAAVSQSALTDATGAYSFPNLRPGTYAISETQPAGYLQGTNTIGSQGGTLGNDRFYGINLGEDVKGINNNFGEILPAEINGYVYIDKNKNGLKDTGEPGIASVPIELTGTDDQGNAVIRDASTDASGFYDFNGLRPGNYAATELVPPAGYEPGQLTRGNVTPLPNSLGTYVIPAIDVAPDGLAPNNNFGVYPAGNPQGNTSPAKLVNVQRLGIHHQPTRFVLTFDTPLQTASAEDVSHYQIAQLYKNGTVGKSIPFKSAYYNPTSDTVTLTPVHRLNFHDNYRLTVSGIIDANGNLFDGNGDGVPGGTYVGIITKANYHGPLYTTPSADVAKAAWAQKFPRLAAEQQLAASPAATTTTHPRVRKS